MPPVLRKPSPWEENTCRWDSLKLSVSTQEILLVQNMEHFKKRIIHQHETPLDHQPSKPEVVSVPCSIDNILEKIEKRKEKRRNGIKESYQDGMKVIKLGDGTKTGSLCKTKDQLNEEINSSKSVNKEEIKTNNNTEKSQVVGRHILPAIITQERRKSRSSLTFPKTLQEPLFKRSLSKNCSDNENLESEEKMSKMSILTNVFVNNNQCKMLTGSQNNEKTENKDENEFSKNTENKSNLIIAAKNDSISNSVKNDANEEKSYNEDKKIKTEVTNNGLSKEQSSKTCTEDTQDFKRNGVIVEPPIKLEKTDAEKIKERVKIMINREKIREKENVREARKESIIKSTNIANVDKEHRNLAPKPPDEKNCQTEKNSSEEKQNGNVAEKKNKVEEESKIVVNVQRDNSEKEAKIEREKQANQVYPIESPPPYPQSLVNKFSKNTTLSGPFLPNNILLMANQAGVPLTRTFPNETIVRPNRPNLGNQTRIRTPRHLQNQIGRPFFPNPKLEVPNQLHNNLSDQNQLFKRFQQMGYIEPPANRFVSPPYHNRFNISIPLNQKSTQSLNRPLFTTSGNLTTTNPTASNQEILPNPSNITIRILSPKSAAKHFNETSMALNQPIKETVSTSPSSHQRSLSNSPSSHAQRLHPNNVPSTMSRRFSLDNYLPFTQTSPIDYRSHSEPQRITENAFNNRNLLQLDKQFENRSQSPKSPINMKINHSIQNLLQNNKSSDNATNPTIICIEDEPIKNSTSESGQSNIKLNTASSQVFKPSSPNVNPDIGSNMEPLKKLNNGSNGRVGLNQNGEDFRKYFKEGHNITKNIIDNRRHAFEREYLASIFENFNKIRDRIRVQLEHNVNREDVIRFLLKDDFVLKKWSTADLTLPQLEALLIHTINYPESAPLEVKLKCIEAFINQLGCVTSLLRFRGFSEAEKNEPRGPCKRRNLEHQNDVPMKISARSELNKCINTKLQVLPNCAEKPSLPKSLPSQKIKMQERMEKLIKANSGEKSVIPPPPPDYEKVCGRNAVINNKFASYNSNWHNKSTQLGTYDSNYEEKIPKGKLFYLKDEHVFLRYFDELQTVMFLKNVNSIDDDTGQRNYRSGDIIKIDPSAQFCSTDKIGEPEDFIKEISLVQKNVPPDFAGYYTYVAGFQIVNGHEPVSFLNFLTMHNTNGLQDLFQKYVKSLVPEKDSITEKVNQKHEIGLSKAY